MKMHRLQKLKQVKKLNEYSDKKSIYLYKSTIYIISHLFLLLLLLLLFLMSRLLIGLVFLAFFLSLMGTFLLPLILKALFFFFFS